MTPVPMQLPAKVLHVEGGRHYYGGARQVVYLLEGLSRRGIENVLVCPPGAAVAGHAAPFARVLPTPLRGDLDIGFVARLRAHIRAERPDLVHLHSRRGVDVWGGLAARLCSIPCVLSRRVDNRERAWAAALKYRLFDRVIAISEGIRDVLLDEGVSPQRVRCVRSALDARPWLQPVDRAAFLREFALDDDTVAIGVVAQMIRRKGHRHLFEALKLLLPKRPQLHVLLFGQGPLRAELEARAARDGLASNVRFVGFRDDLTQWMGALDVLAHPADREGLGIALLQAQAAGVPVVATRAGGMPEVVDDGVTGLLVEPGDVLALADALRRLVDDPALREQMGAAARARVLGRFSVDAMVDGNLAVYRETLQERAMRSGS
ncbi:MAG: glycosyltransferase [Burkholderiaceae bacterium]|nr:glycosyltransferase [Burkholderiaceae bacterium]